VARAVGQNFQAAYKAAGLVEGCNVKLGEIQGPLHLLPVQVLHLLEVLQVLVICPDLDRMLCAFEEVLPFF
jgi:hypothetical protein